MQPVLFQLSQFLLRQSQAPPAFGRLGDSMLFLIFEPLYVEGRRDRSMHL